MKKMLLVILPATLISLPAITSAHFTKTAGVKYAEVSDLPKPDDC